MNLGIVQPALCLAAVGLPLALALGFARPTWREPIGKRAAWAAVPALLAALWPARQPPLDLDALMLGVRLGVDDTGRGFLFLTAFLWMASGWFAQGYLKDARRAARFHFFWLLAVAGNVALVLAGDMLGFYAGFALMSFSSYGLVIHSGESDALRAGRVYLALVVAGELLLFAGLVMLADAAGGVSFEDLKGQPPAALAALLVLAGFGIKAGALPLHVWLPLAHPAAPVPASAVLSGAMIKAGLLGWIRFLPVGAPEFSDLLIQAGLAAAFLAAAVGVTQSNPKTVLAYSSISQMGLMTIGMGAVLLGPDTAPLAVAAVTLYALHHGLAKGALFLAVGMTAAAATPLQRRCLRAGMLLPALALAGAPWTSGAVAKTALKASLGALPPSWTVQLDWLLPLAAAGTTLLMARFLVLMWVTETPAARRRGARAMWASWLTLLAAVASVMWIWAPATGAARDALLPAKLWPLLWPVLAGSLGAGLAWRAFRRGMPWPHIPAGDLLAGADWAVAALRERLPAAQPPVRPSADDSAKQLSAFAGVAARLFGDAIEDRLGAWPTAGLLLILLSGGLLVALAAPNPFPW